MPMGGECTNGKLILCIEDERDLLQDIAEELVDAGYRVMTAISGEVALQKMHTRQPDLIICDIAMPGMDGYQVLEKVRARGPDQADVPFLFLTAFATPPKTLSGSRHTANDYLVKPIDYDRLLRIVAGHLHRH